MNRRDIYIYPRCQNHFRELSILVATNLILMLLPSHYGSHDHQLKMLYNYGLHFNTDNQIDRVLATLKITFPITTYVSIYNLDIDYLPIRIFRLRFTRKSKKLLEISIFQKIDINSCIFCMIEHKYENYPYQLSMSCGDNIMHDVHNAFHLSFLSKLVF